MGFGNKGIQQTATNYTAKSAVLGACSYTTGNMRCNYKH